MWDSGGIALPFVTSALDIGEWLVSCPGCFIPGEGEPTGKSTGEWVEPRTGPGVIKKKLVNLPEI
jgi:hypothetical protein